MWCAEAILAAEDPAAYIDINALAYVYEKYYWRHSQIWREALVDGFNSQWGPLWMAFILKLAMKLAACYPHEQPAENLFKAWRRLCKKGTENGVVRTDRLYATLRAEALSAYVNVGQLEALSLSSELHLSCGYQKKAASLAREGHYRGEVPPPMN